jgi:O-antigen ligase
MRRKSFDRHQKEYIRYFGITALTAIIIIILLTIFLPNSPLEVGAGLLLAVLWLLFFRHPEVGLAIQLVGFPLYPTVFGWLGLTTSSQTTFIFYLFLATSYLIGGAYRNRRKLREIFCQPAMIAVAAFIGWMLFNWLALSINNDYALYKIGFIPLLMLAPLLGSQLLGIPQMRRFLWIVLGIGALSIIIGLKGLAAADIHEVMRLSVSEFTSPLGFAYSIGASAVVAVSLGWLGTTWLRLMVLVFVAAAVFLIAASGSRGPLLALGATFCISVLMGRRRRLFIFAIMMLFVGILPLLSSHLPDAPLRRIQRTFDVIGSWQEQDLTIASAGRSDIWATSVALWSHNPLVGIGVGNYQLFDPAGQFSHNFILEILVELGMIGLVFFTIYFFFVASALRRLVTQETELAMVGATLLVYSLVQISFSGQIQGAVMFWFSSGVVLLLGRYSPAHLNMPPRHQFLMGRKLRRQGEFNRQNNLTSSSMER